MYVKPAPGVLLRDPVTKQLLSAVPVEGLNVTVAPAEGLQVGDFDLYWVRRLRDGDAVRVAPAAKAVPASQPDKTSA
ncbi:Protein of unknown function [Paraburkholderia caballeronis]|uniref:DUF2635 domain-containing protein n=2 Tax=Paraburkholderia caballeronis TaxID=416943 RepID=A0A1H7TZB4_9BURK|nr:uncharacterized protein DUF2635 [Paraburkholderia caballeronis]PXW98400.1 uncharacterized protein DUF2635 [Paraburkholderia caballeronis]RAJ95131.1 uncharacterized protein DUF2635 [Paraburkholderia caballeronis]SEC55276.1 Protein of unknown function [Paraburkholderia caballeronis]SEL89895.1 Protein of unknown function [Paraburkholderia caballeronis]